MLKKSTVFSLHSTPGPQSAVRSLRFTLTEFSFRPMNIIAFVQTVEKVVNEYYKFKDFAELCI